MSTFTYPNGEASTDTVTNLLGWGVYSDSLATPTQTITTTDTKFLVDALGANTNETYLPNSLTGGSSLWDGSTSFLTPASVGDSYDLRIDFTVSAKGGSPTTATFILDIGGGASPTIPIVERTINLTKTAPFSISIGFPIFCLNTFVTNGGQIFLRTDTGSITISTRSIFISRNYSATA